MMVNDDENKNWATAKLKCEKKCFISQFGEFSNHVFPVCCLTCVFELGRTME